MLETETVAPVSRKTNERRSNSTYKLTKSPLHPSGLIAVLNHLLYLGTQSDLLSPVNVGFSLQILPSIQEEERCLLLCMSVLQTWTLFQQPDLQPNLSGVSSLSSLPPSLVLLSRFGSWVLIRYPLLQSLSSEWGGRRASLLLGEIHCWLQSGCLHSSLLSPSSSPSCSHPPSPLLSRTELNKQYPSTNIEKSSKLRSTELRVAFSLECSSFLCHQYSVAFIWLHSLM